MLTSTPTARLVRGCFRPVLALTALVGALCLSLVALLVLMRLPWVNEQVRRVSKQGNGLARTIAGTRLSSRYLHLAALHHVGRMSGRPYVTPLAAYPLGDGFVLVQTYPTADWARNVLATGTCTLLWNGRAYALEKPERLPRAVALQVYPRWVRFVSRTLGVQQFLWVHRKPEGNELSGADGARITGACCCLHLFQDL